jgi:hypothetical protein
LPLSPGGLLDPVQEGRELAELGRIVAGSFAIEIVGQFLEFCADEVL